jgi:hypothetical protein
MCTRIFPISERAAAVAILCKSKSHVIKITNLKLKNNKIRQRFLLITADNNLFTHPSRTTVRSKKFHQSYSRNTKFIVLAEFLYKYLLENCHLSIAK